jgi:hypothetical protein
MSNKPAYTGADLLLLLAPPLALVEYLDRLWGTMASNGKEIPPAYTQWLERWQRIRAEGLSDVDYVLADEWASLDDLIRGRVNANQGQELIPSELAINTGAHPRAR